MSSTISSLENDLNNVYPVFEPNQLLTSAHLNQLRIYLDTQDRLSRVKLVGMGIVCGLDLTYQSDTITISAGTGITSEGFLVHIPEESFTKAREAVYADPKNYEPFLDPLDTVTGQIPMWELLPNSSTVADTLPLTQAAINIQNKVVVLFVEYNDIDLESCVGQNCDDKGINREFTIRKLLINCTDVDKIIRDWYEIPFYNVYGGDLTLDGSLNLRYTQDYAAMPSFTLLSLATPPANYNSAYQAIDTVADINLRYEALFPGNASNPLWALATKIEHAYTRYSPFLAKIVQPSEVNDLADKFREQFVAYQSAGAMQYYYDYSKDIVKAYNEFVDLAFEITAECCPSLAKFPRHLLLGKVTAGAGCPENENTCKPALYRTHFIQSPIYNDQKDELNEASMAFKRLVQMIHGLSTTFSPSDLLKITPSDEKQHALSYRSIPFYYEANPLYKYWNYRLSKKCKADWNLGYRSGDFDVLIPSSQSPLNFDKDPYNFYRIEGLLGKDYKTVRSELEILKRKFDLEFDILPLKLRLDNTSVAHDAHCGIIDLKEDYLQLRTEIIAETKKYGWLLNKFFYFITNSSEILADFSEGGGDVTAPDFTPSDLLAGISQVEDLVATLPTCIDDFELDAFKMAFKEIQEFSFIIAVLFEKFMRIFYNANTLMGILMAPMIQNFIERFFLVNYGFIGSIYDLNDILRSHLDVRMHSLYFSYQQRLALLEKRELFSNFAKHNPGLRHMAGVPQGGTFIMVYGDSTHPNIVADFAMSGKPCCCEDEFEFCREGAETFPPAAKNVYFFIDDKADNGSKVYVNVLEFAIDLNVEVLDIVEFPDGTVSVKGGGVTRVESETFGHAVVEYTVPNFEGSIDEFEFTIINESGKTDKACVFIARVSMGVNFFANIGKALDGGFKEGPPVDEEAEVDPGVTGVIGGRVRKPLKGVEIATLYDNSIKEDINRASIYIDETNVRYRNIREIGKLPKDPTPEDKLDYERKVVAEFKPIMRDTQEEIAKLDALIGETPSNPKDALIQRMTYEKKFAERAALVALYEDQTKELLVVIEKEKLAETKDSVVYDFVDKDVRSYTDVVSKKSARPVIAMGKFGKTDGLASETKGLFDSFGKF